MSPVQSKELQADARRQLLERRPDILQAEQLLRSANAQVGESLAESFPKIGLTALLGKVSPELSGFTLGSANAWGIAAEGSGPLFEGGRLVGQYKQSKAARNEFELRYRQTVLNAFRAVSDALVSREQFVEVRQHQAHQVSALGSAVKLSTERYVAGKSDYYEVLEAQQQLFPTELNLARTQRDQLVALVTLYKTLGGGCQDKAKPDNLPPPTQHKEKGKATNKEIHSNLADALDRGQETYDRTCEKFIKGAEVANEAVDKHPYRVMGIVELRSIRNALFRACCPKQIITI